MNYIQLINAFWAKAESDDLKGNDISVYFSLLKYCNKLNWLNPFVCHWDIVCQYAKVSKNSYYKSVEKLSDKGYIRYEKGKKNQLKPKIVILKLENKEGTIKEQNGEQNEEQKGNLYKLLNKKTIKLINNNASLVNSNLEKWIDTETNEQDNEQINKETSKQSFEQFWILYDKKVDKKRTLDKWLKLNQSEINAIIEITPKYVKANSDVQYRKNPLTFLNGRCWEDEIQEETKSYNKNSRTSHVHIEKKTTVSDFVDIDNL